MDRKLELVVKNKLKEIKEAHSTSDIDPIHGGSLYTGIMGSLLFRLYYQRLLDETDEELEETLVDFIEKQLNEHITSTTFCSGISGFAWFLYHLKTENFIDLDEELFVEFDDVVFKTSRAHFENENHDFMHGSLGNLVYLIERSTTSEVCKNYVIELIGELKKIAIESENGTYWLESEIMLDPEHEGKEVVNLHLSHGIASKIMILTIAVEKGIEEAKDMLSQTVKFLLSLEIENAESAILPNCIIDKESQELSHLGWCRGNISISIVLINAARALKDKSIEEKAIQVGLFTLQYDTKDNAHLTDSAICHGTSGLLHMYNRLYNLTKIDAFNEATERWVKLTMVENKFDDGIAGFKTWSSVEKEWKNDFSLLSGSSGLGLTFVSYLSDKQMNWDRAFLLS